MNYKHIFKNRSVLSFIIATIIFVIIKVLSSFFYVIDDSIRSFSIAFKNETYLSDNSKVGINPDLVFVTIDEKTIGRLGFPMSRGEYVPLIENLNKSGAEIIGFDVIFANDNNLDPQGDRQFIDAVKKAGNIVLGGAIIPNTNQNISSKELVELPLQGLYESADNFGYYQPIVDTKTDRVKSFIPEYQLYGSDGEKRLFRHFSIAILQSYYSRVYKQNYRDFIGTNTQNYELKPNYFIPYAGENKKHININFVPTPKLEEFRISRFPTYSFLDVYNGSVDPKAFTGKIVLIGATAKGLKDTFTTPNGIEYGVFVLGNIVNTVLTKNYLLDFPKNIEWMFIFVLLFVSVYFNLSRSGYVLIFSNIALVVLFLIVFPIFILLYSSFLLNYVFELFLALIFSLAIGNIVKYLIENKNRQKLSKALSEYVSKAIANEILTSRGDINLNGEEKELAIFFSDIEGFTTISEAFSPQKLVTFLREYLSEMSTIILDNDGFINKYEGDAIMGLWGTFGEVEHKSHLACMTALEEQKRLRKLNEAWKNQGFPEIKARIGLHIGSAIVGNIGAEGRKMEYTALGDSVNLGSRLEGINKYYGTYICVSDAIYEVEKETFVFRYLDEIRVKGKQESLKIYELIGKKGDVAEEILSLIKMFEEATELYKNKEFSQANEIFQKLQEQGDAPSSTYIKRCEHFLRSGVGEDWDYIWSYTTK